MTETAFFSLSNQITQDRILNQINSLISKNIKSEDDAKSSVLVIKIQKINNTIDFDTPKLQ
jgi:hypothetical protein